MKKGLRHLDQGYLFKHVVNGPRPYEEGIKTKIERALFLSLGTDPDLMNKGLRLGH